MRKDRIILIAGICLLGLSCHQSVISPPPPVNPIPSEAQLKWHDLERYIFIHFSINTFTDKEWGFGDESPELFDPDSLDVNQWVNLFKETGFTAVIITAKHHDGFCLWPSQYTDHTIKNSLYKNGQGDLIKELSDACRAAGLKFGIYVSPWDRNREDYGAASYITYYRNQLRELFYSYGPFFEMWFDGANGGDGFYGGANETRTINGSTYYHWPQTIDMVKKLDPDVIFFSDAGPGVRWVGNERGVAGETNWNMITPDTLYAGKAGIQRLLNMGSENGSAWIPAEVDVSIRPGWFFHESENVRVKSPEQLFDIYLTSVGRGSNLLLNVPPDKRGLIHERDAASLRGFNQILDSVFQKNLATGTDINATAYRGKSSLFAPEKLIDGDRQTFWCTDDDVKSASVTLQFENSKTIRFVTLREYLPLGQRVKHFTIESFENNHWNLIAEGTTIGHKRILKVDYIKTNKLRVNIIDSRACPVLSEIEIY